MRKTAKLNDIKLLAGFIDITFTVLGDDVAKSMQKAKDKVKGNGGRIVEELSDDTAVARFKLEEFEIRGRLYKVAVDKLNKVFGDSILYDKASVTETGLFYYDLQVDYGEEGTQSDAGLITGVLNLPKFKDAFTTFKPKENKYGGWSVPVAVHADSEKDAYDKLSWTVVNTERYNTGYRKSVSYAPKFQKLYGTKPRKEREHLNDEELKDYIENKQPEYTEGMVHFLDEALNDFQSLYKRFESATLDKSKEAVDVPELDEQGNPTGKTIRQQNIDLIDIDSFIEKPLSDLFNKFAVASWFKFRAMRLERIYLKRYLKANYGKELINKLLAKNPIKPGASDKEQETHIQNVSNAFSNALNNYDISTSDILETYFTQEDSNVFKTQKDFEFASALISDLNAKFSDRLSGNTKLQGILDKIIDSFSKARGVSATGALLLPASVKEDVKSAFDSALKSAQIDHPEEKAEFDSAIKKLDTAIDAIGNISKYDERDIEKLVKHTSGTTGPYKKLIEEDLKTDLFDAVQYQEGVYPNFLPVPFEKITDKEEKVEALNDFKKNLDDIKDLLNKYNEGGIITGNPRSLKGESDEEKAKANEERKNLNAVLKRYFNESYQRVKANYAAWCDMAKAQEQLLSSVNTSKTQKKETEEDYSGFGWIGEPDFSKMPINNSDVIDAIEIIQGKSDFDDKTKKAIFKTALYVLRQTIKHELGDKQDYKSFMQDEKVDSSKKEGLRNLFALLKYISDGSEKLLGENYFKQMNESLKVSDTVYQLEQKFKQREGIISQLLESPVHNIAELEKRCSLIKDKYLQELADFSQAGIANNTLTEDDNKRLKRLTRDYSSLYDTLKETVHDIKNRIDSNTEDKHESETETENESEKNKVVENPNDNKIDLNDTGKDTNQVDFGELNNAKNEEK